jgi:hypothetical protein
VGASETQKNLKPKRKKNPNPERNLKKTQNPKETRKNPERNPKTLKETNLQNPVGT